MKIKGAKRALFLADVFNLLVAIYLIVIAIVSLVKLRWYHQLTIAINSRHGITSATSYFAFFVLIFAGLVLITIFVLDTVRLHPRTYVSPVKLEHSIDHRRRVAISSPSDGHRPMTTTQQAGDFNLNQQQQQLDTTTTTNTNSGDETFVKQRIDLVSAGRFSPSNNKMIVRESIAPQATNSAVFCSIMLYLLASVSLIVVLVLWLLNTGELVRESISTQLDSAFNRYQFSNRSNQYSVAIDGMQEVNGCCGLLEYTDFPRGRGLSGGHYPGSCCKKTVPGVNVRTTCVSEEIRSAGLTYGCTRVLSNYYDLISLLIVPVALISLFVNITIIGLIVISRADGIDLERLRESRSIRDRFELKSTH